MTAGTQQEAVLWFERYHVDGRMRMSINTFYIIEAK
jgi:hypothetical protein